MSLLITSCIFIYNFIIKNKIYYFLTYFLMHNTIYAIFIIKNRYKT